MSYKCKIIADSVAENKCRLVTFEVTFPLIVLAELNTHRMLSRNVASSRAIPVKKMIEAVQNNPFVPEKFPKNQSGMQNTEWLEGQDAENALATWLTAANYAVVTAETMLELNVHKQIANRLLAPFLWTTAVITATDWKNFFTLRCHEAAQPEIRKIAEMMREEYEKSEPTLLRKGEWHLPYINEETRTQVIAHVMETTQLDTSEATLNLLVNLKLAEVSVGRCARVSYLRQSEDTDWKSDAELCQRLAENRHLSPFEHVAFPLVDATYYGNVRGWNQYRKMLQGESGE